MTNVDDYDGNVAYKCTYHDGGRDGYIGYDGTCSVENMFRNVRTKKVTWCSQDHNPCSKYLERDCKGPQPEDPCYESTLLRGWTFGTGFYHNGEKEGQPIPMQRVKKGKVALLTTRLPTADQESKRVIFAACKIAKVQDNNGVRTIFDKNRSIIIPTEVAPRLPYWRFKQGEAHWGTGLFRYLTNGEVAAYLRALYPHLQSPRDQNIAAHLLDCVESEPPEVGDELFVEELSRIPLTRKYGPGGEGERHRQLKHFIAEHPERLGLGPVRAVYVEHSFVTGDRVDVAVELVDGTYAVIEVEVEGETPTMIGAHQALKYRALMAGQRNTTKAPHAFLVAYDIPETTRAFCDRHRIRALSLAPE